MESGVIITIAKPAPAREARQLLVNGPAFPLGSSRRDGPGAARDPIAARARIRRPLGVHPIRADALAGKAVAEIAAQLIEEGVPFGTPPS